MIKGNAWLGEVEGLRGVAALWVFALHVGILCGTRLPLISSGAYGVDLFILISGFIMVHQFLQRETAEPWTDSTTIYRFWTRRFFRIAPLYYPLLLLAFGLSGVCGAARTAIGSKFPHTLTDMTRYSDRSVANLLSHLSFTFGALPHYAFRTVLPDWSIGLEMQFYAVFPLLMILVVKFGYRVTVCLIAVLSMMGALIFPLYYHSFEMPSFLPLRLYLFGMGMLIAARLHASTGRILLLLLSLPIVAHFILPGISLRIAGGEIGLAIFFYFLSGDHHPAIRTVFNPIRRLLSYKLVQQLGLLSYSLYLVHLLVVIPMSAFLLNQHWFLTLKPFLRFSVSFFVNLLIVVPLALLLYTFVEKPGVRVGKRVLNSWRAKQADMAPVAQ
jgi:peptidoglycan/LPS O-acetylase OafA/YrhL